MLVTDRVDVVVIGGGPAGLSAGLNLVRARRRTLLLDANRPRNAVTLQTHGFLTRDGMSPLDLRRAGRDEIASYPEGEVGFGRVSAVERDGGEFVVRAEGVRGDPDRTVRASVVLVATGLREVLPEIDGLRSYYGTALHSCFECDGYEKSDQSLALIGASDDLAERAVLLTQWSADVTVFTSGAPALSTDDEQNLAARGVRVERRAIAEVMGVRDRMVGIRLADGELVECTAGFVRPDYRAVTDYLDGLDAAVDADGHLLVDDAGRTSVAGLWATGECTASGPEQLIVAAGHGARTAAAINRAMMDLA